MKNTDPILEMYIYESTQMIELTETIILDCENANTFTSQSINEIFRNMHTLKGSSAMMQYMSIADMAHAIEDMFHVLREQQSDCIDYYSLSDLVLQSMDFLKGELKKVEEQQAVDGDPKPYIESIHRYLQKLKEKEQSPSDEAIYVYHAIIHFYEDSGMENVRAYQLVHHLQEKAIRLQHEPSQLLVDEQSSIHIQDRGFHLIIESTSNYEAMHNLLMNTSYLLSLELFQLDEWPSSFTKPSNEQAESNQSTTNEALLILDNEELPDGNQLMSPTTQLTDNQLPIEQTSSNEAFTSDKSSSIDLQHGEQSKIDSAKKASADKAAAAPAKQAANAQMISVHVEKLDRLMDLVGELVIAEAMIHNSEGMNDAAENSTLYKATSQLRKITSELQDTAMSIRMIPLTATFHKMRRVARDMSRKLQKELDFVIIGEETEIDKTVIDQISDPLMHLVRNAIDHGIESAEQRLEHNKATHGTITLEAQNIGSDVLVMVKDDESFIRANAS